ncbi:MAG: hypothetical protein R2739_01315 [Chitinophagales bacterium]|nr:hypothetical protein [Bacteroidota bacterium]
MGNKDFHIDHDKHNTNDYWSFLANVFFLIALMICAVLFFRWILNLLRQMSLFDFH